MYRKLAALSFSLLAALGTEAVVAAQELPIGVTATLRSVGDLIPAGRDITLVFSLAVDKDAEVPADLISGVQLDTKVDDKPGVKVQEPGKGGKVALAAGTRLERTIRIASARVLPAANDTVVHVAFSWPGLPGANCVLRIAPDTSKVNIDDLDLAGCKVVLATSMGDMTLAFRPDKAPNHVKNFIKLAMSGFYDGTKFHRVIKGFMVQGGDPNSKDDSKQAEWGMGNSGERVNAEFNDMKHVRGVLSMARGGDPNSASCQFFICHKDAAHLDGQYSAFGNLEKGADVLDAIANVAVTGPQGSTPVTPIVLRNAILLPAFKKK
jgi:peptidyl-prolyl cis-trans isomerase B (cyclophilin B)